MNDHIIHNICTYLHYNEFISCFETVDSNTYLYELMKNGHIYKSNKVINNFMIKSMYIKKKNTMKLNTMDWLSSPYVSSKDISLYYFFSYPNKLVNEWYKINIPWKKRIIQKYSYIDNEIINKYDLFYLQKQMSKNDIIAIGW